MTRSEQQGSWTDAYVSVDESGEAIRRHLIFLDDVFYRLWGLGRDILLMWALDERALELLVVPHYTIAEFTNFERIHENSSTLLEGPNSTIEGILSDSKLVELDRLQQMATDLGVRPKRIDLPFLPGQDLDIEAIDSLVNRYSITLVKNRAVALFDAVGFSLCSPLEQVTQLNSLAYSMNHAYSKLLEKEIDIQFSRTTTGDGFYIWNQGTSLRDAVDLYHFMHLALADNAIAHSKARANTVPLLRTCFHIGSHYEFYQSEGLSPTASNYIGGDVTIELARMIDKAQPGQIFLGDFQFPLQGDNNNELKNIGAVEFIEMAQGGLANLEDLTLSGDRIGSIKCYLTGERDSDGAFKVSKYRVVDKHGLTRNVFNAKVNIHRLSAEPIFLGIQSSDLSDLEVVAE